MTIGRGAVLDPAHVCACVGGADPSAYMWSLAWWPHAILHGTDPLFTRAIWAPAGANVAAAATIPAAAIALWPATALFGPLVSYNLLAILSAPLSALTAYLLCRRVTSRHAASLVGGLLFGFGSYQLSQLLGHLNLTLVFLVPVIVHLTLRRLDGELTRRRFVVTLALALVVQALLSTEILLDVLILGGGGLLVAYFTADRGLRPRIEAVAGDVAIAGFAASLVLLPYLVAALQQAPVARGGGYGLNSLNLVVPTPVTWFGGHAFRNLAASFEQSNYSETDGYIGLPILFAFGAAALATWRTSRATRFLVVMFILSTLAALGPTLPVPGWGSVSLPWSLLERLPLIPSLVPSRIAVVMDLVVAVSIALWLATPTPRSAGRWLVVVLGLLALLPNVSAGWWTSTDVVPQFFQTALYKRYLSPGEDVLVIPFGQRGNSMLWQADTDFYFTMPGGYISDAPPASALADPEIPVLFDGSTPGLIMPARTAPLLRTFLRRHHIRHVVIEAGYERGWAPVLGRIAGAPDRIGGILLFTVR